MFVVAFGGIAYVVVAVVAECHVDYSLVAVFFEQCYVVPYAVSVFYPEEDSFFAGGFCRLGFFTVAHLYCLVAVACYLCRKFFCYGGAHGYGCRRFFFVASALRDIGYHTFGVDFAVAQFGYVHFAAVVAYSDVDFLPEEHRGIAVRVERQFATVKFACP